MTLDRDGIEKKGRAGIDMMHELELQREKLRESLKETMEAKAKLHEESKYWKDGRNALHHYLRYMRGMLKEQREAGVRLPAHEDEMKNIIQELIFFARARDVLFPMEGSAKRARMVELSDFVKKLESEGVREGIPWKIARASKLADEYHQEYAVAHNSLKVVGAKLDSLFIKIRVTEARMATASGKQLRSKDNIRRQ